MFNHVDVGMFLLENGAFIDSIDAEKRSPMLLAASRNCINMVCYLLSNGSNIKLKDAKMRNLLHLIIIQEMNSYIESSKLNTLWIEEKILSQLKKVFELSINT
jgi:ankyrin repeat protein